MVIDVSQNVFFHVDTLCDVSTSDISNALINPIVDVNYVSIVDGSGYTIVTESGNTNDGSFGINTTFHTTDPDIQYIKQASNILKQNTNSLTNATSKLRSKLALYNIGC
jgi:hypothetical protein